MNKKKIIIICLSVVLSISLIGGGIWIAFSQSSSKIAKVIPVQALSNTGDMNGSTMTSGYVQTAQTQQIYLDTTTEVKEVFVQQGQSIEVGDKVLAYDSTLTELELERQKLSMDSAALYLQLLAQEIEELKNTEPSAVSSAKTGLGDDSSNDSSSSGGESSNPPSGEDSQPGEGDGTIEDPLQYTVTEDHRELTAEEWASLIGKVVRFSVREGDQEAYAILVDLTSAQPLAEGATFSLTVERRPVRDTVTILTVLQQDWPGEFQLLYPLRKTMSTKDLHLNGISDPAVDLELTADENEVVTIALSSGGIYLLTADKEPVVIPPEPEPEPEPDPIPDPVPVPEPEPYEPEPTPSGGYTKEELESKIREKEQEYTDRSIDLKLAKIAYQKTERKLEDATVKSTVKGTVKTVADPENLMGSPYIVIAADEGFYVTGTMGELQLEKVKAGQPVTVSSWMTGMSYTGQITEISDYPELNGYYSYSEGNPNASFYRFTAFIDETQGLSNGEGVSISIEGDPSAGESSQSIYLPTMYVRSENGETFVMKRGEDGKLVKQTVVKGGTLYGYYTEIKEGISIEDYVAFPYGNLAKEGLSTEVDQNYMY